MARRRGRSVESLALPGDPEFTPNRRRAQAKGNTQNGLTARQRRRLARRADTNNPSSQVELQDQYNQANFKQTLPDQVTPDGSRTTTFDQYGRPTITDNLSERQQQLKSESEAFQGRVNHVGNWMTNRLNDRGAFNYDSTLKGTKDPRQGLARIPETFDAARAADPRAGLADPQSYTNLPSWQDPRTNVQGPGEFRDMQQQTYQNALADYRDTANEDIGYRRELLEQQLANEGITRGNEKYNRAMDRFDQQASRQLRQVNRDAYRDSHNVASQGFQNQLAGTGQQFQQNYASGDQRYNQSMGGNQLGLQAQNQGFNQNFNTGNQQAAFQNQQYNQGANTNAQQFGQNVNAGNQAFGQNQIMDANAYNRQLNEYNRPMNELMQVMPYVGTYNTPQFQGQIQGPTPTNAYSPFQTQADIQAQLQRQQLANQGSLAVAGTNNAGAMDRLNQGHQNNLEQIGYQTGFEAGAAGNAAGINRRGLASGIY